MTDTTYYPPKLRSSPNPDFNPPPTTGSNAIPPAAKGSVMLKCPFRKNYYAIYWSNSRQEYYQGMFNNGYIDHIEEKFQNCIGKECALWTPLGCKG